MYAYDGYPNPNPSVQETSVSYGVFGATPLPAADNIAPQLTPYYAEIKPEYQQDAGRDYNNMGGAVGAGGGGGEKSIYDDNSRSRRDRHRGERRRGARDRSRSDRDRNRRDGGDDDRRRHDDKAHRYYGNEDNGRGDRDRRSRRNDDGEDRRGGNRRGEGYNRDRRAEDSGYNRGECRDDYMDNVNPTEERVETNEYSRMLPRENIDTYAGSANVIIITIVISISIIRSII